MELIHFDALAVNAFFYDSNRFIAFVDHYDSRLVGSRLFWSHLRIRNHDHSVANLCQACGWTIHAHDSTPSWTRYRIRFETVAIVDVHHLDLFVRQQSGKIEQVLVDGDAALVIEVGLGYIEVVQLRFEHGQGHTQNIRAAQQAGCR